VSPAPTSWRGLQPPNTPWRRSIDQTSRLESPANGSRRNRSGHNGKQRRPVARLPHGCRSEDQTMDAKGTADPETRSRGRSQALLYNSARTHLGLRKDTPHRCSIDRRGRIVSRNFLGGLHHQYCRI
jgi:hypothetical protein